MIRASVAHARRFVVEAGADRHLGPARRIALVSRCRKNVLDPMRIPAVAVLVLAPVYLSSCMPHARGYVGASFMKASGEVALQNAVNGLNLSQSRNSLDSMGIDESSGSAYVRAEADWGPHRVRASGFGSTPSGDGTLTQPFGDLNAGTNVRSQLDYVNLTGAYTWDIVPTDLVRVGLGLQVGLHKFDLLVEDRGSSAFEQIEADLTLPMPCVDAELDLGAFSVCANLGAFEADLGDADGQYFDAEAFARWEPVMGLEFLGGWRSLSFDASGEAGGRGFDADFDIAGWFVGGGFAF